MPAGAPIVVVSTDPTVQQVLSEDFAVTKRIVNSTPTVTITVSVLERELKPGVALIELTAGNPQIIKMLKEAGARAPDLVDTGSSAVDPWEAAAYVAARNPSNPISQSLNQLKPDSGGYGAFTRKRTDPNVYEGESNSNFNDHALVLKAVTSSGHDELIVVAVANGDEDLRSVKKLMAERVANAILH